VLVPAWMKASCSYFHSDLASLVQKIGGDRVAVTSLSRGHQDPHFAPVNGRFLLKLNRVDLFLVIWP
jgi:ABC-type Zn uptake system ZnuABC Zn-binding protein ZnuA